jgi:hypothetical protein
MNTTDCLILALLVIGCGAAYFAYWVAYCWAMQMVWPHGPVWFINPSFVSFLSLCITGLIITMVMLRMT